MPVPDLFNVPSDTVSLHRWSFAHASHHYVMVSALNAKFGATLPVFILDPFDPENAEAWLYQHQQMHNNTENLTGVAGFDLTDVDFHNPEEFASWIGLNAQLHYNEATVLGVW